MLQTVKKKKKVFYMYTHLNRTCLTTNILAKKLTGPVKTVKIWKSHDQANGKILIVGSWLWIQKREFKTEKPLNRSALLFSHENHINGWGHTMISLKNICEPQAVMGLTKAFLLENWEDLTSGNRAVNNMWQQTWSIRAEMEDKEGWGGRARKIHQSSKWGLWE